MLLLSFCGRVERSGRFYQNSRHNWSIKSRKAQKNHWHFFLSCGAATNDRDDNDDAEYFANAPANMLFLLFLLLLFRLLFVYLGAIGVDDFFSIAQALKTAGCACAHASSLISFCCRLSICLRAFFFCFLRAMRSLAILLRLTGLLMLSAAYSCRWTLTKFH